MDLLAKYAPGLHSAVTGTTQKAADTAKTALPKVATSPTVNGLTAPNPPGITSGGGRLRRKTRKGGKKHRKTHRKH